MLIIINYKAKIAYASRNLPPKMVSPLDGLRAAEHTKTNSDKIINEPKF